MQEIVFKPEYTWNLPKYLWLFPFHVLLLLPIMPFNASSFFWLAIFFITFELLMIGLYMLMIKEIRFSDRITISRYLRRDQIAQYSDVQDIILTGFRVDGIYVYWSGRYISLNNGDELEQIVRGLVEKGIIDESKFPEKMTLTQITIIWATGFGMGTVLTITAFLFELLPDVSSIKELTAFIGFIYLFSFLLGFVAGKFFFKDKEAV